MLFARVKSDSPYKTVTACAGKLFVRGEWLQVPTDREDEARRNPFLEIGEPEAAEPEPHASDPGTDVTPTDAAEAEIVPESQSESEPVDAPPAEQEQEKPRKPRKPKEVQ